MEAFRTLSPVHLLLWITLSAILLGGCGKLQKSEQADSSRQSYICEHQWLLQSLSVDGRQHRYRMLWQKVWRDRPYLTCDKLGHVRGSAGANPYTARFSLSQNGDFSWQEAPKILRMGDVEDSDALEEDFLEALSRSGSLVVSENTLILQDKSGSSRLVFRRADEVGN
ncbi:META domain-containing protein [Microbulbifer sp. 2201CG32-9]|uniref:META domain-containing protein n=1 Tax=Microbulbifer sp. 2201CG32-9 TaxID=3232309 RepID=UPI00345B67B1